MSGVKITHIPGAGGTPVVGFKPPFASAGLLGVLPNEAALPKHASLGDAYVIASHIWVYTAKDGWVDGGPLGAKGDKGDNGDRGDIGPGAVVSWLELGDKPADFPPAAHGHVPSDVSGLTEVYAAVAGLSLSVNDLGVALAGLGTASALSAPDSGDAGVAQVVLGSDTRLSDARPASDVSAWAKEATKPAYAAEEVGAEPAITKSLGILKWTESGWVFDGSAYLTSFTESDPTVPGHVKEIGVDNISNWNAAFGWGNHASVGYLTGFTESDPTVPGHVKAIAATQVANWDAAFGWGNHSGAGYLTSFTESDPTVPGHVKGISAASIGNWDAAYGWGNHASAGYLGAADVGATVQAWTPELEGWSGMAPPAGEPVGTTDIQTLENKTLTAPSISNAVMVNPFVLTDTGKPAAPASGNLKHFAFSRAGRILPHFVGPANIDTPVQPALFGNSVAMWLPGTGASAAIGMGCGWILRISGTGAAQSQPAIAPTNALTSLARASFSTGTTSTGSAGIQSTLPVCWLGNAAGLGGFFFFSRFAVETHLASMQYMVGLSALNAALAGEPSVQNNSIALVKDSADTNWFLLSRSAAASTKTATGLAVAAGDVLDLTIFAKPNDTKVTVRLINAVTGAVVLDNVEITTNLPANTTMLYAHAQCRATAGSTAKTLSLNRIYVETDL